MSFLDIQNKCWNFILKNKPSEAQFPHYIYESWCIHEAVLKFSYLLYYHCDFLPALPLLYRSFGCEVKIKIWYIYLKIHLYFIYDVKVEWVISTWSEICDMHRYLPKICSEHQEIHHLPLTALCLSFFKYNMKYPKMYCSWYQLCLTHFGKDSPLGNKHKISTEMHEIYLSEEAKKP